MKKTSLEKLNKELKEIYETVEFLISTENFEDRNEVLNTTLLNLERTTFKSRRNYLVDVEDTSYYLKKTSDVLRIKVEKIEEGILIEMPQLISKKKVFNNNYLCEPLRYELEEFVRKTKQKKLKNCVIIFNHIYENEYKIIDYDNLESKSVIDNICLYLLIDDNGKYVDFYHTSSLGDRNYLQIYLVEKHKFLNFMSSKKLKKKG